MVSQEMVSPLKVSHSFVEDWFFGYKHGTSVDAREGNSLKDHSKKYHGVHNPYVLGAAPSSGYILSLCGGLST
jgi:hypothetical protein